MVRQGAEIPSVNAPFCPQPSGVVVFIFDRLAPQPRKWIVIPIVRFIWNFVCQFGWINAGTPHHVKAINDLGCQPVPQLEWEITIGCCKGLNKRIFKCLYCAFSCIHVVIMGLNELKRAFFA